jgi:nucleotide-binding universal stress UspA family protein
MTKDIKTILVPIDFSETSEHALEYGAMLAKRFAASIHLVYVCEAPSMPAGSMDGYANALLDWSLRLGQEAGRQLTQAARRMPEVKVSTEVLFGNPANCIVTAATTNAADLIVMGTHGHGALLHVIMGNVASRVVGTAPCPVLTVHGPQAIEWHRAARVRVGAMAAA